MRPKAKRRSRYRLSEGKRCIEVRVRQAQQLFDARDPAPFRDRDLDDDFAEYVSSSNREIPHGAPIKLVIYVGEPESTPLDGAAIREALRGYYDHLEDRKAIDLRMFVKRAQFFLLIGLLILFGGLWTAYSIPTPAEPDWTTIFREGLIIFSWVSMWKPIELILFDWYPLFEDLRMTRRLADADVQIKFATS